MIHTESLNSSEKEAIRKYFGKALEELTTEEFQQIQKELRAKYHPDNFEKFEDETVREMATERFQLIEKLSDKLEAYFDGKLKVVTDDTSQVRDVFYAFNGLKIEIMTSDKDLKYDLFGTFYRWLQMGERFKVPDTPTASIVMDESHQGTRIGYNEAIRMYLTFDQGDAIEDIVDWLYQRIQGRATGLLIHGEKIEVDAHAMLMAIRKPALLE